MKIARRRDVAPVSVTSSTLVQSASAAPQGRLAVELATILDGHLLWVAIAACPGRLALRAGDHVVSLPDSADDDQPGYLACCLDLDALPADGGPLDVVLVRPGPRAPVPLWTPPLPPVGVRAAADEHTVHVLRRAEDGTLRVATRMLPAATVLERTVAERGGTRLHLIGAGRVLAAFPEGEDAGEDVGDIDPIATWSVDGDQALLSVDPLLAHPATTMRLLTGEPGAWRPIRRQRNGLADPRRGATMPELLAPSSDEPRGRLRWSLDGLLEIRMLQADTQGGAS